MSRSAVSCELPVSAAHFDVVRLPSEPSSSLLITSRWRSSAQCGHWRVALRLLTPSAYLAEVRERLARRVAWVPWYPEPPVGSAYLLRFARRVAEPMPAPAIAQPCP